MIRVVIEYHDAATCVETWPVAYRDREQAMRFLATMADIHSVVVSSIVAEVWCEECEAWELEDDGVCQQCAWPCCDKILCDYDGDLLCPTCVEDRDEGNADPMPWGVPAHGPL